MFLLGVSAEVKQTLSAVQDAMGSVFLWATVALVGLLLVGAVVVYFGNRARLAAYGRAALVLAVGFAVAMAVCGLALNLIKYNIRGSLVPTTLYPLVATVAAALLGGFALWLTGFVNRNAMRVTLWVVLGAVTVPLVVTLVYIGLYFKNEVLPNGYYVDVSTLALVLSCVGLVVLAAVVALLCGKKGEKSQHTRAVAYAGVSIALAFALSYIKLFSMPQGGSVTLASMLPIMLYSCRYGTRKGLMVGLIYGLLQAVQDPYVIHPAQFLLDYPLAFAMLGLAGWAGEIRLFGRHRAAALLVGCISAFFLRYIAHTLSGIFAFAAYAHDAQASSVVVYSFAYNSYVLIDGAMCLALGILMYLNRGSRATLFGTAPVADAEGSTDAPAVDAEAQGGDVAPMDKPMDAPAVQPAEDDVSGKAPDAPVD